MRQVRTAALPLFIVLGLGGCTAEKEPQTTLGPSAETVRLVVFFSDGPSDAKTVGEWALIHTGEELQVKRGQLKPDRNLVTSDWNGRYLPSLEGPARTGAVDLKLDRARGIVCLAAQCGLIISICPPVSELKNGKHCSSYKRNKE